jgi:hypothetical protein
MTSVFDALDRETLALLGREYLLCGHLIDRAAMPYVFAAFGLEAMRDVAIDEWMGASPIYTRRVRRAMRFEGDDVATIFKGMQLDIGAPPQFMDFRYKVIDADHGEFALAHCGALMDVEPMGENFVVTMCHHIEDPTFDATASATNPRARMRPVHRPPRAPADRQPHCLWTVQIDEAAEPLTEPDVALRIRETRAATVSIPLSSDADGEGRTDYKGTLEPDLHLEEFSRNTLIALIQEICLQGHLLTLAFTDSVERRSDANAAASIASQRFIGIAGVAAGRLKRALGLGSSLDDVARVLNLHPAFHPRSYIDVRIARDNGLKISLHDCPAIGDRPGLSWADVLAEGDCGPLDAMVQAVDPTTSCTAVPSENGAIRTWQVASSGKPAAEKPEVAVTKISTGAEFSFETR